MIMHKFMIDSNIVESIKKNNITLLVNSVLTERSNDLFTLTDIINTYAPELDHSDENKVTVTFRLSDNCTKYISIIHANNNLTLQQTFEGLLQAIIYSFDLSEYRWQNRKLFK